MIGVAHVGGLPLEELLPALAGIGGGLAGVRAWLALGVRGKRGGRS